ncbi:hypothetical protein T484DRAFT_1827595, partial [Baffinella frigidus]
GLALDLLDSQSDHGKRFLANLYVRVQEVLNSELRNLFQPKQQMTRGVYTDTELKKILRDWFRLAEEAQINRDVALCESHLNQAQISRDVALCESHLNQRVTASPHDAQLWYEFGKIALQNGTFEKAHDCLREALAIDPRHVPALLTYGVFLCRHDRFADAESYFLGATNCDPSNIQASALRMLFYDMESRDLDRRALLKKVLDLEIEQGVTPRSAYLRAAEFATELKALSLVERCQSQEIAKNGNSQARPAP